MRPRKFRLHFNRVNMQRGNPNIWTVHLSNRCIQVQVVEVQVPIQTVYRPTAEQPRAFLTGTGIVTVKGHTAYIR